ncbi:hypothetical protein DFH08DRAFT_849295 [Mycena albidolilacea]|uniref:Uncharacterized protein n=1 Tax=Mycena albidolilacea TaxID=1033008 RepID=A0AAD7AE93_9AGAR|nr:hypothetical protein DFH08DRAFT_849295 [Mycena albidolilacea]
MVQARNKEPPHLLPYCLNPQIHSDIPYLAPDRDESHPFSYAQIIGIFYADVVNTAPGANPKLNPWSFCGSSATNVEQASTEVWSQQ